MRIAILSTLAVCLLTGCSGHFKAGYQLEANWDSPQNEVKKKE